MVSRQSNLIVESTNAVPRSASCGKCCSTKSSGRTNPTACISRDITGGFTTTARAGLQAFKVIPVGGLPRLSRRAAGRTGARRGYRGHAAGQLRQDPGHLRQDRKSSTATAAPNRATCRFRRFRPRSWFPKSKSKRRPSRKTARRCLPISVRHGDCRERAVKPLLIAARRWASSARDDRAGGKSAGRRRPTARSRHPRHARRDGPRRAS